MICNPPKSRFLRAIFKKESIFESYFQKDVDFWELRIGNYRKIISYKAKPKAENIKAKAGELS